MLDCLKQGSHLVPLAMCLSVTKGPVLELGSGRVEHALPAPLLHGS